MITRMHADMLKYPYNIGAVVTGGGAGFFTKLLALGGMSACIESLNVPYGLHANAQFMNNVYLPSYCSDGAAILLCAAQMIQMLNGRNPVEKPLAIAVTASLKTPNQRVGRQNHAYICIATEHTVRMVYREFNPDDDRAYQEQALEEEIFTSLMDERLGYPIFNGSIVDFVRLYSQPLVTATSPISQGPLVFPGSFNPWHDGHSSALSLAHKAFPRRGNIVIEVTGFNADKGHVSPASLLERLVGIPNLPLMQTDGYPWSIRKKVGTAPTFVDKLNVYSNPIFVVGTDTMYRIGNPEYYRDYDASMDKLANNAQFFVVLRGHTQLELKEHLPANLYDKCTFCEHEFAHVSSSEIKNDSQ